MAVNSDERMDKMMQMMQAMMEKQKLDSKQIQKLVEKQDSLQKQVESIQKDINTFVTPLYRVHPVPEDVVSQLTDKTFHETAKKYYGGTNSCVILGQLFSPKKSRNYASRWFPAVAEHIVPKAQWTVAENWGFHTTDAKNALLLLKDVELKYQTGRLTLIPAEVQPGRDELILVVEISEALKDTVIKYVDRQCSKFAPVKGKEKRGELKELKFRDLHGQQISVRPPPHMRALFLKAEMAHRQHQELTNPSRIVDRYTQRCPSMTGDLIQRLLASNSVGPA
ncbi:unnamed protein product [Effrenium voratum]|uniref:Uncharacterized protein n=1 Tax=Effrenium voratum TaxID=2562239 RepID=A0AA36I3X6_9DINO|nr:unnamed protein product [Effrenium voratum]